MASFVHLAKERDRTVEVNAPDRWAAQSVFLSGGGGDCHSQYSQDDQSQLSLSVSGGDPGGDLEQLDGFVTDFVNQLRQSGFIQNVQSSFEMNKPELKLDIDRDRASALRVSIQDISRTLRNPLGGLDISRINEMVRNTM